MNTTPKLVRWETLRFTLTTFCCMAVLATSSAIAGDKVADPKEIDNKKMVETCGSGDEKNWATELSTGVLFSNVRSSSAYNTTLVPVQLAGVMKIDDVSLDDFAGGVFRGNTEFLFRGDFYQTIWGRENHLGGISVGPRYNFVQPGWKIVPFVEGTVGVLFADSDPLARPDGTAVGLGQDFNFTFGVAAGFRYDINDDWYLRLACDYMHVSNAGLSEPAHQNKAIDALGPKISVGYRF